MNLLRAIAGKEKLTGQNLLILGCAAVLFLLFTAWSVGYTSRSEFCGACHEMTPMQKTWQASSHKAVACIDCHSEPGFKGFVKAKTKGLKDVWFHVTGKTVGIKADERDINCYSCHQDKVKTNVEKALAARDPHSKKHFDNGMTCVSCHAGIVHDAGLSNAALNRDTCTTCHLDQMKK